MSAAFASLLTTRLEQAGAQLLKLSSEADILSATLQAGFSALQASSGAVWQMSAPGKLALLSVQGRPRPPEHWSGLALALSHVRASQYFETSIESDFLARSGARAALPLLLDGACLGLLVLEFSEERTFDSVERHFLQLLAGQCAVALGRARLLLPSLQPGVTQNPNLLRANPDKRAAALDAFVAFSEGAATLTDTSHLVRQAARVLRATLGEVSVSYYTAHGGAWTPLLSAHDAPDPRAAAVLSEVEQEGGVSGEVLFIASQEPGGGPATAYCTVNTHNGHGLLVMTAPQKRVWSESERAVFRAVGRSLTLALERTAAARQLATQNLELAATTQALESFADLTRDLSSQSEPRILIERALNAALALLPPGYGAFWETARGRWYATVQVADVGSAALQATIDAGLPIGSTPSLDWPAQQRQPLFQGVYPQGADTPPEVVSHVGAVATLPVLVRGEVRGIFNVPLFHERQWSAADQAVLETTVRSLGLAWERAEQAQQLEEERAALAAFVAFTEASGVETDVLALTQQAIEVLHLRFNVQSSVVYYECQDQLWKARTWSSDLDTQPELLARLRRGLPLDLPAFAALQHQPAVVQYWQSEDEQAALTANYTTVVNYPLITEGELRGCLSLGLRHVHIWSARDKALIQAVGRSCTLALERAEQARQLQIQNATLETFSELTRELTFETDAQRLIRRTQEVVLGLLPAGVSQHYEVTLGGYQLRSQMGAAPEPELMALMRQQLPPLGSAPHGPDPEPAPASTTSVITLRLAAGEYNWGVLVFALSQGKWSRTEQAILETAGRNMRLALERLEVSHKLEIQNAELAARSQALEAFAELTRDFTLEHTPVRLIERAQALVLSVLPSGVSTYYELSAQTWKLISHQGQFRNPALLALLQRGVPRGSVQNIDVPFETQAALYQERFDHTTTQFDKDNFGEIQATAALPVFVGAQVRGVLVFGLHRRWHWSAVERAVMQTAVQSLGLALERAQSVAQLAQRSSELERSNSALTSANEELEAFVYSASHDLRTPVRHVMGFAELAKKALSTTPNPKTERYLTVVSDAAQRMNDLIDGMLTLSRVTRQELQFRAVNLKALVAQAQQDAQLEFPQQAIAWEVGELPDIWGDANTLQQVMTNLLSNAVKYSHKQPCSEVRIWVDQRPDVWAVSVQDNGVGFDPKYSDKLFMVFQRLHHQGDFAGTGVGLATVKRIVAKLGGQVFARSNGLGATFGFTLPRPQGSLLPAQASNPEAFSSGN